MATFEDADTVTVNREALYQVLFALSGPGHLIRELQVTRGLPGATNPIDVLCRQYNDFIEQASKKQYCEHNAEECSKCGDSSHPTPGSKWSSR